MRPANRRMAMNLTLATLAAAILTAGGASALATKKSSHAGSSASFTNRVFASGAGLSHPTPSGAESLTKPDDISSMGGHVFVAFQNGVGPQGEPSTTGNRDSTVVEFNRGGNAIGQWDVVGKCDGLTADPATGQLIATVNEDANSSVYLIDPGARRAVHYRYRNPLPSRGGTDAISVYQGAILVSASAPGTTGDAAPRASYPAVYRAVFNAKASTVTLRGLFSDEAKATVANTGGSAGRRVRLALTDPDSNSVVPSYAPRFGGDFMLTSQGDKEQIFMTPAGHLSVLKLSDSVDDNVWPSSRSGAIYTSDASADTIDKITGPFQRGSELVADTPCGSNSAPSTCPAPGFSANYLGELHPDTGKITPVTVGGAPVAPGGMLFVP